MKDQIRTLLLADVERFIAEGLFGNEGDSFSMRIPGRNEFLLIRSGDEKPERVPMNGPVGNDADLHNTLYRVRADAGAVLVGKTAWSEALASLDTAIPTLFDEQARHLGKARAPVRESDLEGLEEALGGGANVAIVGEQRLCLGPTPDRIVFNATLFEKCAKAFVIAQSCGKPVRKIPWWVCSIAGGRLKKDQARAAESLAAGRIPEGMNAY